MPSKRTVSALGRLKAWPVSEEDRRLDDHGEYLLETHLFNFHGDLYDQDVKVEFFSKIRDEKKFGSLEELRAAIADDQLKAKQILGLRI